MSISLYDAVVPSNLQILRALDGVLAKAQAFCTEQGRPEATLIEARLAPDMHPLGYQVKSCAVHSVGGLEGVRRGSFSPDTSSWPTDLAGLRALVGNAVATLEGLDKEEVEALADADTRFVIGETSLRFTGAGFLLSFSQPNFYFHATTAYAILRAQGVPLGKRDYLGRPRLKQ